MKWVGGLNHNISTLQAPGETRSESPHQVSESKYQSVAASLWPVATVTGAELHYICIKKTCYEYEGNGGPQ